MATVLRMTIPEQQIEAELLAIGRRERILEEISRKYLEQAKCAHRHGETELGEEMYLKHKTALETLEFLKPKIMELEAQIVYVPPKQTT